MSLKGKRVISSGSFNNDNMKMLNPVSMRLTFI